MIIVQIQVNTSAKNLFQKPRSISLYKKGNWDGYSWISWGYSWCGLKWSYLQTQYKTKLFTVLKHSKQDSASVAPLHKVNTILSIRTTPRKPLFLMNSSSLFLVGSLFNSLISLCHMKLQESTDADRSMLDISKSVYKKKQTDLSCAWLQQGLW